MPAPDFHYSQLLLGHGILRTTHGRRQGSTVVRPDISMIRCYPRCHAAHTWNVHKVCHDDTSHAVLL